MPGRKGDPAAPADEFKFEGAPGTFEVITPVSEPFCARCSRLRLTADGKIHPCLLTDLDVPVKDAIRSLDPIPDLGPGTMQGIRREFLRRAKGVPTQKASEVFRWIEDFASYGFSAAHAASFAALAYASAYMRTHHPAEFFCGVLGAQPMGFYSPRVVLNEARRAGIAVLPPDVHLSESGFSVEDGGRALRVVLRSCEGLSRKAIDSILDECEKRSFASVGDLYRRTAVKKDALENLIYADFLDALSPAGGRTALLGNTASSLLAAENP